MHDYILNKILRFKLLEIVYLKSAVFMLIMGNPQY